tara:strand:- start:178 stop:471 length:294 start_codon:yes stop_codon:yes gene_type:complete
MKISSFKKIDLSKNISEKIGVSVSLSKKLTEDLLEILSNKIKDNDLNLKNVGSFRIIDKKDRIGRNPKTKEEFIIRSRKSISFIASKNLIVSMNNSD